MRNAGRNRHSAAVEEAGKGYEDDGGGDAVAEGSTQDAAVVAGAAGNKHADGVVEQAPEE